MKCHGLILYEILYEYAKFKNLLSFYSQDSKGGMPHMLLNISLKRNNYKIKICFGIW